MEQIPPRGAVMNSSTMGKVARHFHLAFKGMEAEDIYEILTELFIAAVNKYDPNYTAKVKKVVEVIDAKLRKRKRFAIADVNRHLDIDSNRYIRMLCRRGFLVAAKEREDGPIAGFERAGTWPPPADFFESGAIGLAYYLQNNFRYNLQDWIVQHMRELEAKEGIYSLEGWNETRTNHGSHENGPYGGMHELVVQSDGDFQNAQGVHLSADVELMRKPLDVSRMARPTVSSFHAHLVVWDRSNRTRSKWQCRSSP